MTPEAVLAQLASSGTPPSRSNIQQFTIGLDKTLSRFNSEIYPCLRAGGGDFQFIFGPYGRGKSHFLRAVEATAQEFGLVTAYVDCLSPQHPFQALRETYAMLASAMSTPGRDVLDEDREGAAGLVRHAFKNRLGVDSRELGSHISANRSIPPDLRNLVRAYGGLVGRGEDQSSIAPQLAELIEARATSGVSIGSLYRADRSLPKPIGKISRRNQGIWLRGLLSLPRALGYPGLVVLFDETEPLSSGNSRRSRAQQLANLRNLIDYMAIGGIRGCGIYYAVAEDFLSVAKDHLEALAQRIEPVSWPGLPPPDLNPRSVWTDLDALSDPDPSSEQFFLQLGERILKLGCSAGLTSSKADQVRPMISIEAKKSAASINRGAVRQFVKAVASTVAGGIHHGN